MSNDFLSSFERDPPVTQQARTASVAVDNDDDNEDLNAFQSQYPDIAPYQSVSHTTSQKPQQQVILY